MEFQQKNEIASKQAKAEAKIWPQEKKTAKAIQPRKEDIWKFFVAQGRYYLPSTTCPILSKSEYLFQRLETKEAGGS